MTRLMERLRRELARGRKLRASRGLAMLLVVIVLSTLLIVGVLFTVTASLDVQASAYYRQAAQAELFALEGLYRAIAELYYDVWGVNESVAFVCGDADDPATVGVTEGVMADAAYYSTLNPPSAGDSGGEIRSPWSKFRRSTVRSIQIQRPSGTYPAFTDLRWMIYQADGKGTNIYEGSDDPSVPAPLTSGMHSGAPYHDEFLPEFTDNSDVWELGVHLNSGDIFARAWYNDSSTTGGVWSGGSWAGMQKYWPGRRPLRDYDYVDTRIVGDSFYKIFRFELIDPTTKKSYAAGLDPVTGTYIPPDYTHIGNASAGLYMDNRGGAININEVNNNYQWELYWGWDVVAEGNTPASADSYHMYHYNESKWIYVYDTPGETKLGRYAVMVWPDCGGPNANMQYDTTEIYNPDWGGTLRHTADYLRAIDWGFTPHGGPIGGVGGQQAGHVSNIVSERVEGYEADDWAHALGTRIGDYKEGSTPFGASGGGVITSRAEMNVLMRKACFTGAANASVTDWSHEAAAWDAHLIASLVTVSGYEYLLDHHWANDRLVIDKLGFTGTALTAGYPRTKPIQSLSGITANTGQGKLTRARYDEILDNLRFIYGPDGVKEGNYTQYHDPGMPDVEFKWMTMRAKQTRAVALAWLSNMWYYVRNDFQDEYGRPYGVSFESDLTIKASVTKNDVLDDPYMVVNRTDFPVISEVGKYAFPSVTDPDMLKDSSGRKPWGWGDTYDPAGLGSPSVVYFDGTTEKYFVELVLYWDLAYTHNCMNLDTNYHLYVNSTDILGGSTSNNKTTRVIGIDNKGGQEGQNDWYACEEDFMPKVTPGEESLKPNGDPIRQFTNKVWAGTTIGGTHGWGWHSTALWAFNKYRNWGQDPLPESWSKAHPGNYVVITFDTGGIMANTVNPRGAGSKNLGATTIIFTWKTLVMDVAHLPVVGSQAPDGSPLNSYTNVFECGFDAYDPVNNHGSDYISLDSGKYEWRGNWVPNDLGNKWGEAYPEVNRPPSGTISLADWAKKRASPPWRGFVFDPATTFDEPWHNMPKVGKWADDIGQWLDGLNYHTITTYLPGGEQMPLHTSKYPLVISDVFDSGHEDSDSIVACGPVACGNTILGTVWNYERCGARDWESLARAPTGFWAEYDVPLSEAHVEASRVYKPDPFLRWWSDLMRVTPLERVLTAGYFGNYHDDIASLGEHVIYDEVDNDMDGHIDNLTAQHISGGPQGHYIADRKVMGRVNLNEMQHPASIWYGGFCNGNFGSQTLYVGRKPFKGYTSWVDCLRRGVYYAQSVYGRQAEEPYDMIFWYENQYGDCTSDHTHCGRMIECADADYKDTSRVLFTGNSPVYTVYVTGQVLRDSKDPIAETKLRATVERTWDGKMNILEFSWIPRDIMME